MIQRSSVVTKFGEVCHVPYAVSLPIGRVENNSCFQHAEHGSLLTV